jgi:hypothetical protein
MFRVPLGILRCHSQLTSLCSPVDNVYRLIVNFEELSFRTCCVLTEVSLT